jgi:hypothetical protein
VVGARDSFDVSTAALRAHFGTQLTQPVVALFVSA